MQRAMVLRVGVTIKQIENEHLQDLLVFPVWIIWGEQKKLGEGTVPECPPWLRAWSGHSWFLRISHMFTLSTSVSSWVLKNSISAMSVRRNFSRGEQRIVFGTGSHGPGLPTSNFRILLIARQA